MIQEALAAADYPGKLKSYSDTFNFSRYAAWIFSDPHDAAN
jgi:hypothetical protein